MEIQKAHILKRILVWLCDSILLITLTVLLVFALSNLLGYSRHSVALEQAYKNYESRYGVSFDITQEEYLSLPEQEKKNYDDAYEAMSKDEEMAFVYGMVIKLTLIIASVSLLLAVAVLEFGVPLLFKNGQTLGKKVWGIAIVGQDGVRVNTQQMIIRTFLGKYTLGLMIPVLILIMMMFNIIGLFGAIVIVILCAAQLMCLLCTQNKTGFADLLAGTVSVELKSQRIFDTTEELLEYIKKLRAEQAARQ